VLSGRVRAKRRLELEQLQGVQKHLSAAARGKQGEGQGVPVGNSNCVEAVVVAAGAQGAVFFGHQVQGGRPR
jgi:hypothetical protein